MLEIKIQPEWLAYARSKVTNKAFNKTTIVDSGGGQLVGLLGEIVFAQWFKSLSKTKIEHVGFNNYDYDFLIDNKRIDIKTKNCTSVPQPWYTVHIARSQEKQECDVYVFVRVKDYEVAYLLGWITKQEFWEGDKGRDVEKGEKESNGFTEKADARKMDIKDLEDMQTWKGSY